MILQKVRRIRNRAVKARIKTGGSLHDYTYKDKVYDAFVTKMKSNFTKEER